MSRPALVSISGNSSRPSIGTNLNKSHSNQGTLFNGQNSSIESIRQSLGTKQSENQIVGSSNLKPSRLTISAQPRPSLAPQSKSISGRSSLNYRKSLTTNKRNSRGSLNKRYKNEFNLRISQLFK